MLPKDPTDPVRAYLHGHLPLVEAPSSVWKSIEAALDSPAAPRQNAWPGRRMLALAALIALTTVAATFFARRTSNAPAAWDVVRLDAPGAPVPIPEGQWIDTSATSRARIQVGAIGIVEIEPNSQVRVLAARPTEHRLSMARGTIRAEILAPPRLFFVETPSSTVVDLGCAYTMEVDDGGGGTLRVTSGWASLEWEGRESLVPAGASCLTRRGVGPGTPVFDDASDRMKEALAIFDFGDKGAGAATLDVILLEARVRDTLTLWHLLPRVDVRTRERVVDRIAELAPLPRGVAREAALRLDAAALQLWREELAWLW